MGRKQSTAYVALKGEIYNVNWIPPVSKNYVRKTNFQDVREAKRLPGVRTLVRSACVNKNYLLLLMAHVHEKMT